jgi:anti-sigma regulatory factor (Ser/Thr protein kinase)
MGGRALHEQTSIRQRIVLGSRPEAPAHARRTTRQFLRRLRPTLAQEKADLVELVVSELVTNAVRHARGDTCVLELEDSSDAVVISVHDADPTPPRGRTPDFTGAGGFGWRMVRQLADHVSVEQSPQGKTIRALMPRGGEQHAAPTG